MKHKYISVLSLAVFGAASAYSQITLNTVPERAVGTPKLAVTSFTPNLVEGREFYAPQSVALDTSVSPPILYVSDYVNNRVLAFKDATSFTAGNSKMADLWIGQPDLQTTFPAGPSAVAQNASTYNTGLNHPSGLAVDKVGNLYVADGGNNRVLRYPKPFSQTGQFPVPDLFIGQGSLSYSGAGKLSGYIANYPNGTQAPTPQGLFLSNGTTVLTSSLAFDSSWNLWVADAGNARILCFYASTLSTTGGGLHADLELGQTDLSSALPALSTSDPNSFRNPKQFVSFAYNNALGFDSSGNLFVGDLNRVLVFPGPAFTSGMSASSNMIGVFPATYTYPTAPADVQALFDQTIVNGPSGLFFPSGNGSGVGVVDAFYNRIMIFPAFANWPTGGTPPSATTIVGQPNTTCTATANGTCKAANNGNPQPSNSTFSSPAGVAYTGTDLYLADAGNNRVLDLPQQGATFGPATRVLGQDYFYANSPNLIEGREFQFAGAFGADAGMAIDTSSGTPHLYVADPYNNRVLGFYDLRKFCFPPNAACPNGSLNKADIVLGQADFTTALINYPAGPNTPPTASSLSYPVGLLVDAKGNLYVADSGNGRVLRFPAPFAYAGLETKAGVNTGSAPEPADLVLGQQNFTSQISDATTTIMHSPYGLAFTPACDILNQPCPAPNGLLVSDPTDNRVLYIPTTNGTFAAGADNGKAATVVFGQTSFNSVGTGSTSAAMNNPHHVSCDTNGNVYVADTGNNRVLIFPDPHSGNTAALGQQAATSITGLSGPEGVFVNPHTGEIWVANTGQGVSLRYASLQSVQLGLGTYSTIPDTSGIFPYAPLAVTQDQYGDLFVADNANRVALYVPGLIPENGASYAPATPTGRLLAPGTIATIFPCTNCSATQFVAPYTTLSSYPVPTTLGGIEVLIDGVLSPLYFVSGGQINFIVPNEARTSGSADLEVVQVSTGQILGAAQVPMASFAPGAFECPGGQTGATIYACAINQDGTVNSASNPAQRGQFVSLYMTGQGIVPGGPADGVPAGAAISTPYTPTIVMNGVTLSATDVLYSGINQYPGMWQINLTIPTTVVTTSGVWFAVITPDLQSNWNSASGFLTYLFVK
jgi:uncharacterized protein (TIGR03437 family)